MSTVKSTVKSRGLMFRAPMIRSFLREHNPKAQTRRLIFKNADPENHVVWRCYNQETKTYHWQDGDDLLKCPYEVGMQIYAKETYYDRADYGRIAELRLDRIVYVADEEHSGWLKHSAMFMPKRFARIHRELIDVRAERVNRISEADAMAEGLSTLSKDGGQTWKWGIPDRDGLPGNDDDGWHWCDWEVDPRKAYRKLWDSISGEGSFDSGPWVWCLSLSPVITGDQP